MIKTSHVLTIAAFAATLAGGSAFAQSNSTGAMTTSDHMSSGATTSDAKAHMTSGAMASAAKDDHMASGAMTAGDHVKAEKTKNNNHMASAATSSAPRQ